MNDTYETTIQPVDLEGAQVRNPCQCVVARALRRVIGERVAVVPILCYVGDNSEFAFRFEEGYDAVRSFDAGQKGELIGRRIKISKVVRV